MEHIFIGTWWLNVYGRKEEVIAMAKGWCLVEEDGKYAKVMSEQELLKKLTPIQTPPSSGEGSRAKKMFK